MVESQKSSHVEGKQTSFGSYTGGISSPVPRMYVQILLMNTSTSLSSPVILSVRVTDLATSSSSTSESFPSEALSRLIYFLTRHFPGTSWQNYWPVSEVWWRRCSNQFFIGPSHHLWKAPTTIYPHHWYIQPLIAFKIVFEYPSWNKPMWIFIALIFETIEWKYP